MKLLKICDLIRKRALITRQSASAIGDALANSADERGITLDFAGVDAVTPSFIDEILAVLEDALKTKDRDTFQVIFLHSPTRLSTKFAAVGRAHRLEITESEEGTWIIKAGPSSPVG